MQAQLLADPPINASLALIHCVGPSASSIGVAYIHTALDESALEAVNVILVGSQQLPAEQMLAEGSAHPYLSIFCLTGDGTGGTSMKSRRNLLRASQFSAASG
jgi:hypothetical protein